MLERFAVVREGLGGASFEDGLDAAPGKGGYQILAKFRSFSAVSAPIFARKYAICSIFQNLQDYQAEFFETVTWQNFAYVGTFAKFC